MKIEKEIRKELDKGLRHPIFKISASLEGLPKDASLPRGKKVLVAGSLSAIVLAGLGQAFISAFRRDWIPQTRPTATIPSIPIGRNLSWKTKTTSEAGPSSCFPPSLMSKGQTGSSPRQALRCAWAPA